MQRSNLEIIRDQLTYSDEAYDLKVDLPHSIIVQEGGAQFDKSERVCSVTLKCE